MNELDRFWIGSAFEIYKAGNPFFKYFRKFKEAVYKDKKALELVD